MLLYQMLFDGHDGQIDAMEHFFGNAADELAKTAKTTTAHNDEIALLAACVIFDALYC